MPLSARACGAMWAYVLLGCVMLGAYGIVVNLVKWDFSKLLGVYVAVFATVSVLFGHFFFGENVAPTTWVGSRSWRPARWLSSSARAEPGYLVARQGYNGGHGRSHILPGAADTDTAHKW